jgi:hypothetical protein
METWKLLSGTALLLILWAGFVSVLGFSPGPWALILGTLSGMAGFYLSTKLSARLVGEKSE